MYIFLSSRYVIIICLIYMYKFNLKFILNNIQHIFKCTCILTIYVDGLTTQFQSVPELSTNLDICDSCCSVTFFMTNSFRKRELISRDDLVLPWGPLLDLVDFTFHSKYEVAGLKKHPL